MIPVRRTGQDKPGRRRSDQGASSAPRCVLNDFRRVYVDPLTLLLELAISLGRWRRVSTAVGCQHAVKQTGEFGMIESVRRFAAIRGNHEDGSLALLGLGRLLRPGVEAQEL